MFRLLTVTAILILRCQAQISFFPQEEEDDNDCTTPHNKPGKCIGLRECSNILQLLRRPIPTNVIGYLRGSVCSFSGFLPDVCCPKEKPTFGEEETTTKTPAVNGGWSAWSPWSNCPVSCGQGVQESSRTCSNPAPSGGGADCTGNEKRTRPCNGGECPVDGGWGDWSDWSQCSQSCGQGERKRSRACDSPSAAAGGQPCQGDADQVEACQLAECRAKVELPDLSQCGIKMASFKRIVGGTKAKLHSWPWIAAIGFEIDGQIDYLCGGTLITARHVVTAGHCIRDDLKQVLLGELVLGDDNDGASPRAINVTKITRHPDYNGRSFNNDIAILELQEDVQTSVGIQPICLTDDVELTQKFEDTGVKIAGWGAVNFRGPTSSFLLEGMIRPISLEECKNKFEPFRNVEIDENKYCARDLNDKIDACQGDSGGPLVATELTDTKPLRHYLVGVVSFGYRCAEPGFPGVYTRVSQYIQWIKNNLN